MHMAWEQLAHQILHGDETILEENLYRVDHTIC